MSLRDGASLALARDTLSLTDHATLYLPYLNDYLAPIVKWYNFCNGRPNLPDPPPPRLLFGDPSPPLMRTSYLYAP